MVQPRLVVGDDNLRPELGGYECVEDATEDFSVAEDAGDVEAEEMGHQGYIDHVALRPMNET